MEQKIRAFAERYDMLPNGVLVLVAVSGGMDSMCLLHCLHAQGIKTAAAHFNHRLRGAEADGDEAFVQDWCRRNGIPFYAGSADVASLAAQGGWTVEEAGRRVRYEFLARTAEKIGAERIATAHHAQDNAETMLFNLLRGTGRSGLGGISPMRGRIIRPMLTVTRQEIECYAKRYGVPYRTDSTNADTAYTRNYLRHEVLPLLENVNGAAVSHMSSTALLAREEDAYLNSQAKGFMMEELVGEDSVSLPCKAIGRAPRVLRARIVRLLVDDLSVGKKDFSFAHIDELVNLSMGTGNAQLDLPHGVTGARKNGILTLTAGQKKTLQDARLSAGESVVWGRYRITVQNMERKSAAEDSIFHLRCDTMNDALSVGVWSARENLTLPGKTPRSLKRLFADAGFAPPERDTTPVIRINGQAAAVYGIGIDQAFAPGDGENAVTIEIQKN